MIGIIYKFTIIAKYKYDGHKPFYVGQHVGVNDFNDYWGSGKIWNNFLDRLKKDYPKCWMKLIRREVLYIHECSQKTLDKLEEYYIKKEKAHYSYKQGGCNVLWGAARKCGELNPMKDPSIAKRVSYKLRHGSHHDVSGIKNPNYGNGNAIRGDKNPMKNPEIAKRNAELRKGKKRTAEQKMRMSEGRKHIKYWWSTKKGSKNKLKKLI